MVIIDLWGEILIFADGDTILLTIGPPTSGHVRIEHTHNGSYVNKVNYNVYRNKSNDWLMFTLIKNEEISCKERVICWLEGSFLVIRLFFVGWIVGARAVVRVGDCLFLVSLCLSGRLSRIRGPVLRWWGGKWWVCLVRLFKIQNLLIWSIFLILFLYF